MFGLQRCYVTCINFVFDEFFYAAAISITRIFGYFRQLVCPSLLLVRFRFYEHGRLCLVDVSVPRCKF